MESSALVYVVLTVVTVFLAFYVQSFVAPKSVALPGENCGGADAVSSPSGYNKSITRGQVRSLVAEFAIFCLLTGVSACRIAVGND